MYIILLNNEDWINLLCQYNQFIIFYKFISMQHIKKSKGGCMKFNDKIAFGICNDHYFRTSKDLRLGKGSGEFSEPEVHKVGQWNGTF